MWHPVGELFSHWKTSTCTSRSLGPHKKEGVQVMVRMRDLKLISRITSTIVVKEGKEDDVRSGGDSNRFFDSLSGSFGFVKLTNPMTGRNFSIVRRCTGGEA
jgi:hypothetical protein